MRNIHAQEPGLKKTSCRRLGIDTLVGVLREALAAMSSAEKATAHRDSRSAGRLFSQTCSAKLHCHGAPRRFAGSSQTIVLGKVQVRICGLPGRQQDLQLLGVVKCRFHDVRSDLRGGFYPAWPDNPSPADIANS